LHREEKESHKLSHIVKLRTLGERLSRGFVLRRRLPSDFLSLPIYVTPEAGLRYWRAMPKVDRTLYRMAEELVHSGSTVWDVGANVGLFSFCAAARAGRSGFILAIEPDLFLAHLLTRSSRAVARRQMPCSNVEILCASVSDANRVAQLEIAERARASNHLLQALGSSQSGGVRYTQPSVSVTLDFLLDYFPPPSVLKIDVEGHEAKVLQGARRLLTECRPTVLCEVARENSHEVTGIFDAAGYELYGAETLPHPRTTRAWFQTLAMPVGERLSRAS
jgi:FkbM family methyltransferase